MFVTKVRIDAAGVLIVDTRQVIGGPPMGTYTFIDHRRAPARRALR